MKEKTKIGFSATPKPSQSPGPDRWARRLMSMCHRALAWRAPGQKAGRSLSLGLALTRGEMDPGPALIPSWETFKGRNTQAGLTPLAAPHLQTLFSPSVGTLTPEPRERDTELTSLLSDTGRAGAANTGHIL